MATDNSFGRVNRLDEGKLASGVAELKRKKATAPIVDQPSSAGGDAAAAGGGDAAKVAAVGQLASSISSSSGGGGSVAGGALTGAASGAATGAALGAGNPMAIAAGAVIGGGLGIMKASSARKKAARDAEAEKHRAIAGIAQEKGMRINQALQSMSSAMGSTLRNNKQIGRF